MSMVKQLKGGRRRRGRMLLAAGAGAIGLAACGGAQPNGIYGTSPCEGIACEVDAGPDGGNVPCAGGTCGIQVDAGPDAGNGPYGRQAPDGGEDGGPYGLFPDPDGGTDAGVGPFGVTGIIDGGADGGEGPFGVVPITDGGEDAG